MPPLRLLISYLGRVDQTLPARVLAHPADQSAHAGAERGEGGVDRRAGRRGVLSCHVFTSATRARLGPVCLRLYYQAIEEWRARGVARRAHAASSLRRFNSFFGVGKDRERVFFLSLSPHFLKGPALHRAIFTSAPAQNALSQLSSWTVPWPLNAPWPSRRCVCLPARVWQPRTRLSLDRQRAAVALAVRTPTLTPPRLLTHTHQDTRSRLFSPLLRNKNKTKRKMASPQLLWQCVKKGSAFLVKGRSGDRPLFSKEAGNLAAKHSYKYSGAFVRHV